jgi:ribosomal-protein-alanine N-acetyltransferase
MDIRLKLLTAEDEASLLAFEIENRAFFETRVPGRGDDYYRTAGFQRRHRLLLKEQERGESLFYLVKDEKGGILGRVNLVGVGRQGRCATLGYRVGEIHGGKGIAAKAVELLLDELPKLGVNSVEAKTAQDNSASQRVLEKNGFEMIEESLAGIEENDETHPFVQYFWKSK